MKTRRMEEIKNLTYKLGSITLDELCVAFDVSKNTIRRDVNQLEKDGVIEKVYGGIKAKDSDLLPFQQRSVKNNPAKMSIAKTASQFIQENDIIFIDSGTTTSHILDSLPKDLRCTILTNNFDIIEQSTLLPNVSLYVLGTFYKHKTRSFINRDGLVDLGNYYISKAFMSSTGLSLKGVTNADPLEHIIKSAVCKRADEVILMVDASKYDKSALLTYSKLEDIDKFITDTTPPKEYLNFFKENLVEVHVASEVSEPS